MLIQLRVQQFVRAHSIVPVLLLLGEPLLDPFRSSAEYNYILSSNSTYYVAFSYGPDGAADITGINTSGVLQGTNDDDIYVTNGTGF